MYMSNTHNEASISKRYTVQEVDRAFKAAIEKARRAEAAKLEREAERDDDGLDERNEVDDTVDDMVAEIREGNRERDAALDSICGAGAASILKALK